MPVKNGTGFLLKHKKGGFIGTKSDLAIKETGWLFTEWAHTKNEVNKIEKENPTLKDWWEIRYVNLKTLEPITGE